MANESGDFRFVFELPDMPAALQRLLEQIPPGCVTTFGDLADALGDRRASRWIGQQLSSHAHTARCACHRVVRRDGRLGTYGLRPLADKRAALSREGIVCTADRADLAQFRWSEFRSDFPLKALRDLQVDLVAGARYDPCARTEMIAGVDLSYRGDVAAASYVEIDLSSRGVAWQCVVEHPVSFPYIPTYLAFRELPALLQLIDRVRQTHTLADVVVVDGSGLAHPRHAGIATLLGVTARVATIGVTKSRLWGEMDRSKLEATGSCPLVDPLTGERLGAALLPSTVPRRPLYVSPGAGLSVAQAVQIVAALPRRRQLPIPIYWADRQSRAAARRFTWTRRQGFQ